jgi:type IV pilus assembly protein PilM
MQATDFIIFCDKNILLQQRWYQDPIAPQLNDALQFYYAAPAAKKIDYVVVSGAASAPVMEYFSEVASIKAFIANPLTSLPYAGVSLRQRLLRDSTRLQICCGLALRSASLW